MRTASSAGQTHCLPHIHGLLPACIAVVADVRIPPQAINETAIQIKLFSPDVGIMMKALAHMWQQAAVLGQMHWLAGVLVSLFHQLPGGVQYGCVGLLPTPRAGALPGSISRLRSASGVSRRVMHKNACVSRRTTAIRPHSASAGSGTRPFFSTWRVPRSAARELASKVQGTSIATVAIAECSAAARVTRAQARMNLKMQ